MEDVTARKFRSRAKPKQEKSCALCGSPFLTKKADSAHCSPTCSAKASEKRRQASRRISSGLDIPHPCQNCGTHFARSTTQRVYCTDKCRDTFNGKRRIRKSRARLGLPEVATCMICGDEHHPRIVTTKICSKTDCRNKLTVMERLKPCVGCSTIGQFSTRKQNKGYCRTCKPVERRAPMAIATLSKNYPVILELLHKRSKINESGCWEWQGPKATSGYGCVSGAKTKPDGTTVAAVYVAHRLALESGLGRELGTMQAHHICANRSCVNPKHLQPVTTAQNMGEMRARKSYEARIAELEAALKRVDPSHPVLIMTLAA